VGLEVANEASSEPIHVRCETMEMAKLRLRDVFDIKGEVNLRSNFRG
jgi:hypothetical protein